MRVTVSAASYPTRRMSCAHRSPPSASTPRSRSLIRTGRPPGSSLKSYWPNNDGCSGWSKTCLLLARADEHVPLSRAPIDLDDLAFEEGHRLRSTTPLQVDTSGVGAARVLGDADALRRVLRNLGENAARHASSRIDIALGERGGDVVLTVDDDGPGIPESERDRVLGRFVRLDAARSRDEGGSGLGLSIVDEVVLAHGGSISISQSPLGGARIQVTLPADEG